MFRTRFDEFFWRCRQIFRGDAGHRLQRALALLGTLIDNLPVVVFAVDKRKVSAFYQRTLGLAVVERAAGAHVDALAEWRGSPEGLEAPQFGAARLRGYRRVRELARGSVSELFLAESVQGGNLVVLKVTRDLSWRRPIVVRSIARWHR
mgnify:CR=1 FL=1